MEPSGGAGRERSAATGGEATNSAWDPRQYSRLIACETRLLPLLIEVIKPLWCTCLSYHRQQTIEQQRHS